jgi:hypothetical protein
VHDRATAVTLDADRAVGLTQAAGTPPTPREARDDAHHDIGSARPGRGRASGVGTLIALGAMFGKLLADSGGADQIVASAGPARARCRGRWRSSAR